MPLNSSFTLTRKVFLGQLGVTLGRAAPPLPKEPKPLRQRTSTACKKTASANLRAFVTILSAHASPTAAVPIRSALPAGAPSPDAVKFDVAMVITVALRMTRVRNARRSVLDARCPQRRACAVTLSFSRVRLSDRGGSRVRGRSSDVFSWGGCQAQH